jgi:biopolymer transport protein TolQ
MAMHNALWEIVRQTDSVTKLILFFMTGMSILCWTLAFYIVMSVRMKIRELQQAQAYIRTAVTFDDFLARVTALRTTFGGYLVGQYLTDFTTLAKKYGNNFVLLTQDDWQELLDRMYLTLTHTVEQEGRMLGIFSTSAQAAPLIGLFGTVWGLIHAFLGIGQQKTADIAAVAPGIAEALITTLGGLVVAIPALVMFNYLQAHMRMLESQAAALTEHCRFTLVRIVKPDTSITGYPLSIAKDVPTQKTL